MSSVVRRSLKKETSTLGEIVSLNYIKHSKLQYQDSLPFNLEVTPPSAKGKEVASSTSVEAGNGDHQSDMSAGFVGSNRNGKRTIIDLDEYDKEAAVANRAKKQLVTVKIEKP
ncbi:hypothetical protein Tco_0025316 [Tanacetum coccineum]